MLWTILDVWMLCALIEELIGDNDICGDSYFFIS